MPANRTSKRLPLPSRTGRRAVLVGAAGALVVAGVTAASPAMAAGPGTASPTPTASGGSTAATKTCSATALAAVKAKVGTAVSNRETAITGFAATLASRAQVTADHRATLSALYAADAPGLQSVNATVQAATDCRTAVTAGKTVVTSYRVYMLLGPQTRLTAGSDTGLAAAAKITASLPAVQKAVDGISDPTKKAQAEAALADLTAQAGAATADLDGVGDTVLALKPADMPAGRSTLDTERAKVANGGSALKKAAADAATIKGLL